LQLAPIEVLYFSECRRVVFGCDARSRVGHLEAEYADGFGLQHLVVEKVGSHLRSERTARQLHCHRSILRRELQLRNEYIQYLLHGVRAVVRVPTAL
jgi:hypothetical protein